MAPHQRPITITVITVSRNTFLFLIPELTIYIIYKYIIYIVKFHLTFLFPSDTPSVKTVITVIVIAVITLDALKQCIKVEDKIHKSPNESSTNHRFL